MSTQALAVDTNLVARAGLLVTPQLPFTEGKSKAPVAITICIEVIEDHFRKLRLPGS